MPLQQLVRLGLLLAAALIVAAGVAPALAHAIDDSVPIEEPAPGAPSPQALVDAARRYIDVSAERADLAGERANRELARCEADIDAAPTRVSKALDNLIANYLASSMWVTLEPAYARLAFDIASAAGDDPALRQTATAARTLHDVQAPFLGKPIQLCRVLTKWKKAQWSRRFPATYRREFAPSLISSADQERVKEAKEAAPLAVERLQELGAPIGDALLFEAAFSFVLV